MLSIGKRKLIDKIIFDHWGIESGQKQFSYNELLWMMQEVEDSITYHEGTSDTQFAVFKEFVRLLLYRNMANYDSMILCSGDKGIGKSNTALVFGYQWCKLLGIKFDPAKHIAYTNSQITERVDNCDRFHPLILDESINVALSENWGLKENRHLKKKLGQIRTKHLFYFMCFPLKIYKVDKTYLQSYTNYWCQLFARGRGALFVKDQNPVMDAWRLSSFKDIGSFNEFSNVRDIEQKLKKHPNFWRIMKIPKAPQWLYDKYIKVRERNIYDEQSVLTSVTKEDIERALLILSLRDIMQNDTTLSVNRILLHIKNEYGVPLAKSQVEANISDAQMLVNKLNEQAIYYNSAKSEFIVSKKEDGN